MDGGKNLQPLDFVGAPGMNRTCDTRIRNPVLYPLSYGGKLPEITTLSLMFGYYYI